jgi:hypothetical protein
LNLFNGQLNYEKTRKKLNFVLRKPKTYCNNEKLKRKKFPYNSKFGQTADATCERPTGRQHLDIYVTLVSFRSTGVGDGKLTSVTVLRGCRPRLSLESRVSLPNISLERIKKQSVQLSRSAAIGWIGCAGRETALR